MKKIKKKLFPILKRAAAFLSVFVVLVCSLVSPAAAVDYSSDGSGQIMRPLFDYNYLEVYYDGGQKAVFNLKDVFYSNFMMDNRVSYTLVDIGTGSRSITFNLTDFRFEQLNIYIGGQYVKLPYWNCNFDISVANISNVKIGCSETIYNYNLLSTAYSDYKDQLFFFDANDLRVDSIYSYTNTSSFFYPVFSYDSNGNIVGRTLASKDLSHSTNAASGPFPISPTVSIDTLLSLMPSNQTRNLLYFSDFETSFTVPEEAVRLNISVFYVPESNVVTFKDYHDTYFPAYRTDNVAVDFTGWLSTAVGGFLSFEFVPGISLSTLLLFMLGVGAFHVFLKFFAGG